MARCVSREAVVASKALTYGSGAVLPLSFVSSTIVDAVLLTMDCIGVLTTALEVKSCGDVIW